MSGAIFVSYRRDDAKHAAGRLYDRLSKHHEKIFIDVENIPPGADFRKVLTDQVTSCDVLLTIIGPSWLHSQDEYRQRRLDNPNDFVRIEIEAALARDVPVVPVLVDGAQMPKASELPPSLQPLAFRHAVRLTHETFAADADDLAISLKDAREKADALRLTQSKVRSDARDLRWSSFFFLMTFIVTPVLAVYVSPLLNTRLGLDLDTALFSVLMGLSLFLIFLVSWLLDLKRTLEFRKTARRIFWAAAIWPVCLLVLMLAFEF